MNGIQEAQMSEDVPSVSPIIGIEKKKRNRDWEKANPEKIKEYHRKKYLANKEKIIERSRQWRIANPEASLKSKRKWQKLHPENGRIKAKRWAEKNPDKIKAIRKRTYAKRRLNLQNILQDRMSGSIRSSFRYSDSKIKKRRPWESLVNFTLEELKLSFESKFTKGMTWELFMNGAIHIDHIIPVSAFNFEKPEDEDFKRCWVLTNLQPLWAFDNISKGKKLFKHFQPRLIFRGANDMEDDIRY